MHDRRSLRACTTLSTLIVFIIVVHNKSKCATAESVLVVKLPKKSVAANRAWSWTSTGPSANRDDKWDNSWTTSNENLPPQYSICAASPITQPNQWLTSTHIDVRPANRIGITIEYEMFNCSDPFIKQHCRQNYSLYVLKSSTQISKIPDPYTNLGVFEKIGTLIPKVLTFARFTKAKNEETFSVMIDAVKPFVYLAFHYQGGCVSMFSVSVHYYRCPAISLTSNLVQLPLTTAPANGSVQMKGSCSQYTKPLTNDSDLYGYCKDDGEWSTDLYHGECGCDYGYGKFAVNDGSECRECPLGTFKNTVSNSNCTTCPLNSIQDTSRTRCNCEAGFYRTDNETTSDNCTGQPSAPQNMSVGFFNATFVTMTWAVPSSDGGRSDLYYTVECKQCNDQGTDCTIECTGSNITVNRNAKLASIKRLSSYTYYQFKVYANNGVSKLAEKNNEKAKYVEKTLRTKETIPGSPVVTLKQLSSTSVFLSWELQEKNGVIKYYLVSYFPVDQPSNFERFNTTFTNATITGLETGKEYRFQVRAVSRIGLGQPASRTEKVVKISEDKPSFLSQLAQGIIGGVVGALILTLIIVIICLCRRKRRRRSGSKEHLAMSPGFIPLDGHRMYIDPSNYGSPMEALLFTSEEINRQKIELEKSIGGGEFADVYKGNMNTDSGKEVVAVKILKPKSSHKNREDFVREASIMGQFKHANVIALKGVVTGSADTPMMIVTEYMANGSLEHFLKSHDGNLTTLQLLGMIRGVADGMAYLSGMNFIHRDIAARNILVADNMASKVADFGLSRELDDSEDNPDSVYQTQGGKIPVRWTAPEAIRYKKFSSASDVWSFGILMWEIVSFAERPYWDWDNFQVMDRVDTGYRLPAPMNCPKAIHNLMLDCWEADKNKRPKFADIVKRADEMIRSPDKLKDNSGTSRFSDVGAETNFGEVTSVEEWLDSIHMAKYMNHFEQAGYVNLETIKALSQEDLTRMGVKLIGHRNKINKSIKAMKRHFDKAHNKKARARPKQSIEVLHDHVKAAMLVGRNNESKSISQGKEIILLCHQTWLPARDRAKPL